jgi:hypothetical protein
LSWPQRDIGIFDEDVRTPGRQLIEALLDAMVIGAGAVLLSHSSLLEQQQPSTAKHHARGVDPQSARATLRCRIAPCRG